MKSLKEFKESVLSLHDNRKHKVSGSIGVYDIYKKLRKLKWLDIGRPLTEHEFYTIIRSVNKLYAEELINGNDVVLPNRMGRLELRKREAKATFKDGKLKITMPVDWNETIKLWHEDKECYNNKTLVRYNNKEVFKVNYNIHDANYNNKSFFQFFVNRDIKKALVNKIKNNEIDAFEYGVERFKF